MSEESQSKSFVNSLSSMSLLINREKKLFSLSEGIDADSLAYVMHALTTFEPHDRITMLLATGGGDVEAGLGIYDLLKAHPGGVRIIVCGFAQSMGAIILQAGVERLLLPNANIMAHWGNQSAEDDNPENFRRKLKFYEKLDDKCNDILLEKMREKSPKLTKGNLKRKTANDFYLTADEAVNCGLADRVIYNFDGLFPTTKQFSARELFEFSKDVYIREGTNPQP